MGETMIGGRVVNVGGTRQLSAGPSIACLCLVDSVHRDLIASNFPMNSIFHWPLAEAVVDSLCSRGKLCSIVNASELKQHWRRLNCHVSYTHARLEMNLVFVSPPHPLKASATTMRPPPHELIVHFN